MAKHRHTPGKSRRLGKELLKHGYIFLGQTHSVHCPVDGFEPLAVEIFFREHERSPLVLDFIELAIEEARRTQLSQLLPAGGRTAENRGPGPARHRV